jgi:hypothetical protein
VRSLESVGFRGAASTRHAEVHRSGWDIIADAKPRWGGSRARERQNGVCATATGNGACTRRAAVQEINAFLGADTIILPADHYGLTLAGAGADAA